MERVQEKQTTQKKYSYIVVFDCLVSDDVIEKRYHGYTYDEVVEQAMEYSKSPCLSFGNFDIYHSEDEIYDLNQKLEKAISYDEYQADMLQHRKQAVVQTKKAIAQDIRLELLALKDIADSTNDERTKNQLYKRLNRLEKVYKYLKGV
jgi:hypothetical protein